MGYQDNIGVKRISSDMKQILSITHLQIGDDVSGDMPCTRKMVSYAFEHYFE